GHCHAMRRSLLPYGRQSGKSHRSPQICVDKSRCIEDYRPMPARNNGVTRSRRPARGLENEVFLNLLRTADALLRDVEQILKAVELSHTQYNVLRILRGAGRQGLACQEIGERMLTRDPDITRLLDRLEARALVSRARGRADRRVVQTRITPAGLR